MSSVPLSDADAATLNELSWSSGGSSSAAPPLERRGDHKVITRVAFFLSFFFLSKLEVFASGERVIRYM
jgi:hypothetical protein